MRSQALPVCHVISCGPFVVTSGDVARLDPAYGFSSRKRPDPLWIETSVTVNIGEFQLTVASVRFRATADVSSVVRNP